MRSLKEVFSRDPRSELGLPPKVEKTPKQPKASNIEGSQKEIFVTPLFATTDTLIDTYDLKDYFSIDPKQAILFRRRMGVELVDFIHIWAVKEIELKDHEIWKKDEEKITQIHNNYFQPFSNLREQNNGVSPRIAEGINYASRTFVDKFFRFNNDGTGTLNHPLAAETLLAIQGGYALPFPDPQNETAQESFRSLHNDPDMQSARERLDTIKKTEARFA